MRVVAAGLLASRGFEADASQALNRLRLAVARLVEAVPGGARRAADLQRSLDLDAALAWQVHALATQRDSLLAGQRVPKAGAMQRFLGSARELGLPAALTSEGADAFEEFERVVGDHAGDRETFQAMVSALRPQNGAALQRLRRAAFRANSAVWGVSTRCTMTCGVFWRRPTGEHDGLTISGRVGLRRLREGAVIGIGASSHGWGGATVTPEGRPLDAWGGCELLEEYCSSPVPKIEHVDAPDGMWTNHDILRLEGVGRTAEVTIFWKNVLLAFAAENVAPHGTLHFSPEPTETLIMDLLVPRGWTDPSTARAWMTPAGSGYPTAGADAGANRLPFEGAAEHLGSRLESLHTAEAPRYSELVAGELAALGWDGTVFDVYRCVFRYPVLHSMTYLVVAGPK